LHLRFSLALAFLISSRDAMRNATGRPFGVSDFMSFVRAAEVPLRQQQNAEGREDGDLPDRERRMKNIGAAEAQENSRGKAAQRVRANDARFSAPHDRFATEQTETKECWCGIVSGMRD
jgi:hypothetical protein